MTERNCHNCDLFVNKSTNDKVPPFEQMGECRRHPPQAKTVGMGAGPITEWGFPEVVGWQWCGEWQAKKPSA